MTTKHPLLILILSISAATAGAQDAPPINAERPGFSSSPSVLGKGYIQVETGYQYLRDDGVADLEAHTLPQLLIRLGLAERLEAQLAWGGYTWAEVGNVDIDGRNDASVGAKWQLNSDQATVPVALFAGVSLPIGNDQFTTDEVDPTVGAFWSYSGRLDWFGTVLVAEPDDDTVISNAVGISVPLGVRSGSYVEYFGNYGGSEGPEHYLNAGLTWLPGPDLQLDVQAGFGLNGRAADLFLGFGLAYRY